MSGSATCPGGRTNPPAPGAAELRAQRSQVRGLGELADRDAERDPHLAQDTPVNANHPDVQPDDRLTPSSGHRNSDLRREAERIDRVHRSPLDTQESPTCGQGELELIANRGGEDLARVRRDDILCAGCPAGDRRRRTTRPDNARRTAD